MTLTLDGRSLQFELVLEPLLQALCRKQVVEPFILPPGGEPCPRQLPVGGVPAGGFPVDNRDYIFVPRTNIFLGARSP